MPGFGFRLRVAAGGKINRTWVCQYRHGGATRRMLLGSAAVLGAEQARVMAKKALGKVANGDDPQADRQDRRDKDKHTFRTVVADYLAMQAARRCVRAPTSSKRAISPTSVISGRCTAYALDQITRSGRCRPVEPHQLGKQLDCGRARPRPACPRCFVWALTQGLTEANPVVGTAQPTDGQPRERVLSDAELSAHLEGVRRRRSRAHASGS